MERARLVDGATAASPESLTSGVWTTLGSAPRVCGWYSKTSEKCRAECSAVKAQRQRVQLSSKLLALIRTSMKEEKKIRFVL